MTSSSRSSCSKPDDSHRVHYIRQPFSGEPDFNETSRRYALAGLLERAEVPA